MQLNRIVAFHKTMGDPTRVRIITLLAQSGPLHGQALAGKLGVTPPTISHHLNKLKEINLVFQRRDKNTIYFHLNHKLLKEHSAALLEYVKEKHEGGAEMDKLTIEKQSVLRNFFTKDGRLKSIPAQRKKKLYVFEHLVEGLEKGRKYPEKEINEYIKNFHDDFATIRREFIINHYMYRENNIYELNPKEMWAKIES
ncbi:DUF2087 domain-containing protein [Falsibacillus albus]|uniref:DUF2087 domain-containing protein n=1 Tax=Falsibacillus albus TaxID=2478915 RepID=A0A3L7K4W3_9BACI|nr:metalloregulator ArsR/SmtB family transcription factor [Falsibacillus albus]RLQ97111.1 DUF2087 domain-containing protein [Falsibacillus albus]